MHMTHTYSFQMRVCAIMHLPAPFSLLIYSQQHSHFSDLNGIELFDLVLMLQLSFIFKSFIFSVVRVKKELNEQQSLSTCNFVIIPVVDLVFHKLNCIFRIKLSSFW